MVALLVGGHGECLLPDCTSGLPVKVREKYVKYLRVPADRMTLNVLLDVLDGDEMSVRCTAVTDHSAIYDYDLPRVILTSQICYLQGK